MDSEGLHMNIENVGSSGFVLSIEQKASLQTSLVILKCNYKFHRVLFWGKILGVKNDYFIVQGAGKDELKDRKSLYSRDCVHWGLLPIVNESMRHNCSFVKGRFTGDPSYEYEHVEIKKVDSSEGEATDEENTILIKEEDRLATTIEAIDYDVRIVPRGSYIRTSTGSVNVNRHFEGLSLADSGKLSSYFHFREPFVLNQKTLLQKAELEKAIDFLDPIDGDVPKGGSWSIQCERGSALVTLRSLHWLGFTFYHAPGSRTYGSIYVGLGTKNLDLPFML